MNAQIYISRYGWIYGPYSIEGIQALIVEDVLFPSDFTWYEGLDEWIPLNIVPGIVFAVQPQPQSPHIKTK